MHAPSDDPPASPLAAQHRGPHGGRSSGGELGTTVLYAAATLASAFLLFLVQPMVGKRMLPWFGGAPAIWMVCLAFYQTVLLVGYAYAHALTRIPSPLLQLALHGTAVAAAFTSLPVLPETPPPLDGMVDPTRLALGLLARDVALPFVVLSATGPLVQHWFTLARPADSPYVLYAVSNLGSFAALLAYPFALEPNLPLSTTGQLWDAGFALGGALVTACAIPAFLARRGGDRTASPIDRSSTAIPDTPSFARFLYWTASAAMAVVVLMGVTNKLCLDVASAPFLWLLPLATYLATFILAFSSDRAYHRGAFAFLAIAAFAATRAVTLASSITSTATSYCLLLFGACTLLHGELYRSRPAPIHLTRFYLATSAGGALGGLLVGIVSPLAFDDYIELPLGLLATLILVLAACAHDPKSLLFHGGPRWRWLVAGPLALASAGYFLWRDLRPRPFTIDQERSFFGVLSVHEFADDYGPRRVLVNGTTRHGMQWLGERERRIPTAYFATSTGLGLTLESRPSEQASRVGVVGLGAGTLAAYGRDGDSMRFYEIDPVVARIAGPGGYFSFVEDSAAKIDFVIGDARRSIEDEQQRGELQRFDVLVLDAFSSDAIPIHLMTREAFEGYFRALSPDGIMMVHVTNRHFDLPNLVSRLAQEFGAFSLQLTTDPVEALDGEFSNWVVIGRDAVALARLRIRIEKRHRALGLLPGSLVITRGKDLDLSDVPLWTDDFSDLSRVVRWR